MYSTYTRFVAITPSDTVNNAPPGGARGGLCDAIYVGGVGASGTLVFISEDGTVNTVVGLLAGTIYPFAAKRVNATTTTCTNLVALYKI